MTRKVAPPSNSGLVHDVESSREINGQDQRDEEFDLAMRAELHGSTPKILISGRLMIVVGRDDILWET